VLTEIKQIPIAEGFFTWPSAEPRLIGGRCKNCGRYFFPKAYPLHKVNCQKQEIEEVLLSKWGKLQSYTWQYYQPPPPFKAPEPFVPYGISMVELPEGLNVVGIMTDCTIEDLKIGMEVEIVVESLYCDEQGNEYLTWKFKPRSGREQSTHNKR